MSQNTVEGALRNFFLSHGQHYYTSIITENPMAAALSDKNEALLAKDPLYFPG